MKKLTLLITLVFLSGIVFSQAIPKTTLEKQAALKAIKQQIQGHQNSSSKVTVTGDFENGPDFDTIIDGWGNIDVDGLPTYGFTGITFPGNYNPHAYNIFNPASTTPAMTGGNIQPHAGAKFATCFASVPAGGVYNDDWLITPIQSSLPGNYKVTFWVKSYIDTYGLEKYEAYISTTTQDVAGMTTSLSGGVQDADTSWTEISYNLSTYAGQNVCVGIHCTSQDAFIFMLDDVVFEAAGGTDDFDLIRTEVFPNPTTDHIVVNSQKDISIKISNILGDVVYENASKAKRFNVNTSDFSEGIYFLQMQSNDQKVTKKFQVVR